MTPKIHTDMLVTPFYQLLFIVAEKIRMGVKMLLRNHHETGCLSRESVI